jgi:transcriptional repressor NrdR
MVCIYCNGSTQVINSRPQKRTNTTWRRRQCQNCSHIFTTEESALLSAIIAVEASNGSTTGFEREKLLISLYNSLRHRPTALKDAVAITNTVITKLLPQATEATIQAATIITTASQVLKRFDTAADVQYRAYHPISSS